MTKNGRTAVPDTADYEISTILDLTNRSGTAEIADLKNIEFSEATLALELGLCRIKKLEFCDNSGKNVEILTLRGNLIEKIENLGRFGDSLRRLDLYGNEITDFGGLAELRGLRSLDLR
jgi:Leucine-rich repeat (LRR) protein